MLSKADILFGRIAVNSGMATEEQVDECVRLQDEAQNTKPLGLTMLEKGYISQDQLNQVIQIQQKNLQEKAVHSRQKRIDSLFGRLVVKLGFATEDEVNECVRVQARIENDIFMRLGEILVRKGYMTPEQVTQVLDYQKKKILTCPVCKTQFNVIMFTPGAVLHCHKCNGDLKVPETVSEVDAEDYDQS
jgi:hypothetical protein